MTQPLHTPIHAPKLDERRDKRVERIRPNSAPVIHEAIRREGEEELSRPTSALAFSGLAAGLSMGFSLVAEAVLRRGLPAGAAWLPLIAKLGYSFGFLIVIVGRQQLFTENTLTAVLPLLARRDLSTLARTLRLWAIVLVTNVLGTLAMAALLASPALFDVGMRASLGEVARHAFVPDFGAVLIRGVVAGWIIATLVWMLPAARNAQVSMIILMTWLVSAGEFSHIIAGSVDTFYLVLTHEIGWLAYLWYFFVPTLVGNIIGGVSLVAALNHAQVVSGHEPATEEDVS